MSDTDKLVQRAEALLGRIEKLLPAALMPTDWKASTAAA
jgi:predicted AAA+ superfamily ATPase